ncbi:phosphatidylinositol 3- and 4-kinase [Dictyocaulus viviparus]|uniref:Phosphatidylinositol 4-kinase type 2 n=1 Tax=Dictyocaulus viviparus TaxID=29172 RepID=A0A0D8YA68_DICVI|nr:phosphatidylinositol 3- and 4-kinase [Dictyocaulus viviparus]
MSILTTVCSLKFRTKSDEEFKEVFRRAQEALENGIHPVLIPIGSSGSYFIRDKNLENIAVFKPSDEEPFAALNPKWPKFFQRWLCFCCFGRACLIPNNGYLSETGASIVDDMLELRIVPKTRIRSLASPSFFYSRCCGHCEIRPKEGSFQLFVKGYESAQTVFSRWDYDKSLLSQAEEERFKYLFQKMIVLDYIIRNTDRHMDNLLIRHVPGEVIELAAIDNGLAFPVKHPECVSRFRTFPFRWTHYRWANEPWDTELRMHLLSSISPAFLHDLCHELKILFRYKQINSRYLVFNQMRVVRGQVWNLYDCLAKNEQPADLTNKEPILVTRRYRRSRPTNDNWSQWFRAHPCQYNHRSCC